MNNPLVKLLWTIFKCFSLAALVVLLIVLFGTSSTATVVVLAFFGYYLNLNFVVAVIATTLFMLIRKVSGREFSIGALLLMFIISCPFYVNGNDIVSLWGGTNSAGNIYSLCSIYQNASGNAFSLFNLGVGQYAGKHAFQGAGICFSQTGENVTQGIGGCFKQFATNKASQKIGICFKQYAGNMAEQLLGISFMKHAPNVRGIGISVFRTSPENK